MTTNTRIVYLLDDDQRIRESAEALLSAAGYQVWTFAHREEFLRFPKPDKPACLILDLHLGDSSGLELQQMLADDAALAIVFLTGNGDIASTVKAMRAGAVEFLSKPIEEEQLLRAIDCALAHAELQWTACCAARRLRSNYECLTRREREVLPYVVKGFLNKQTAYELGRSEITIRIHRSRIMQKMQADSLAELVRMAVRIGVLAA